MPPQRIVGEGLPSRSSTTTTSPTGPPRSPNAVYDVPEGRPVWKTLPIRVGVTIVVAVLLTASVLIVVLTGSVAEYVGDLVGTGATAVTVWTVVKWPVLVILISQILALLLGAEFDAELHRGRAIETGHPEGEEPFMALRDDRALDEDERA